MSWFFDTQPIKAGLKVWIDSRVGLTVSGGTCSAIQDLASGYSVAQATGANQPSVVSSALAGFQALRFNGTSQYFNVTGGTALDMANNVPGFSAFIVYNPTEDNTFRKWLDIETNTADTRRVSFGIIDTTNDRVISGRRLDTDAVSTINTPTNYGNGVCAEAYVIDYANALGSIYRNDIQVLSPTGFQTAGNTSATTSNAIYIGAQPTGTGPIYFLGDLGTLLLWNRALSPNEVSYMFAFAKKTWNVY